MANDDKKVYFVKTSTIDSQKIQQIKDSLGEDQFPGAIIHLSLASKFAYACS